MVQTDFTPLHATLPLFYYIQYLLSFLCVSSLISEYYCFCQPMPQGIVDIVEIVDKGSHRPFCFTAPDKPALNCTGDKTTVIYYTVHILILIPKSPWTNHPAEEPPSGKN